MKDIRLHLTILYVMICATIFLRVHIESTGYRSPDSHYYLKTALNLKNGEGPITPVTYPFNENTPEAYTAIWPLGYPALIAATSHLTGSGLFWSSKVVNLFFLGLIFILLYQWFRSNSLLPAFYFCSFNLLEIFSYTWSEGTFIFLLLASLYLFEKVLKKEGNNLDSTLLAVVLILMVLVRYAGLIYFVFFVGYSIVEIYQKRYDVGKKLILILFISGIFILTFLIINYYLSGGIFGGKPRIVQQEESWYFLLRSLLHGIINEILVARNFYWKWDELLILLTIIQFTVISFIIFNKKLIYFHQIRTRHGYSIMISGIFYLIFIVFFRKLSQFDTFDYRILSSFSVPILIYFLGNLNFDTKALLAHRIKLTIYFFFILSLITNLPKKYILEWAGFSYM